MDRKLDYPASLVDGVTLFWFRRDLRLTDNAALYYALKDNERVLPVFIFDTQILNALDDKHDMRVEFVHQSVLKLKTQLEELGSSLLLLHGDPVIIYRKLRPAAVYANDDYEPYARTRDGEVKNTLEGKGIPFMTFKDHVIFEKIEIVKDDGAPYTVFTPYSKKWKTMLRIFPFKVYPVAKHYNHMIRLAPLPDFPLSQIGFEETMATFPERVIHQRTINVYDQHRDFPALEGTTHLSVHLRFGTVSIRVLAALAQRKNESFLTELIWRDFYHMILWNFPHVAARAFKPAYERINWRNDPREFQAWCEGKTGYPFVDAGMRELNATGFMHNRVRMITASFLTKHLMIDWRWGEAYFAKKLLDFDLAANNGGWQWAAGSGCDAAPYFRIFNPTLQIKKFDPQRVYIKKWIPELDTKNYQTPIVEHTFARARALRLYSDALNGK